MHTHPYTLSQIYTVTHSHPCTRTYTQSHNTHTPQAPTRGAASGPFCLPCTSPHPLFWPASSLQSLTLAGGLPPHPAHECLTPLPPGLKSALFSWLPPAPGEQLGMPRPTLSPAVSLSEALDSTLAPQVQVTLYFPSGRSSM